MLPRSSRAAGVAAPKGGTAKQLLLNECKLWLTLQSVKINLRFWITFPVSGIPTSFLAHYMHVSSQLALPESWPDRQYSRFVELDGLRWHVQLQGQGPVVLLLHGTAGATTSWASVTRTLARSHTVLAVDLPGHGFTIVPPEVERARNPFALGGMARVLASLLHHLQLSPTVAVGHSAGASVLLRMVLDGLITPQRLIGINAALVAPPAWYVALVAPLLGVVVESDTVAVGGAKLAAATRIIKTMLDSTGTPLSSEQLARYEVLCRMPTHVHAALSMMARWDLPTLLRDAARLTTPLAVIAGRRDRWVPEPQLARAVARVPGATYRVEDGGHLLMEERGADVAAWITA